MRGLGGGGAAGGDVCSFLWRPHECLSRLHYLSGQGERLPGFIPASFSFISRSTSFPSPPPLGARWRCRITQVHLRGPRPLKLCLWERGRAFFHRVKATGVGRQTVGQWSPRSLGGPCSVSNQVGERGEVALFCVASVLAVGLILNLPAVAGSVLLRCLAPSLALRPVMGGYRRGWEEGWWCVQHERLG